MENPLAVSEQKYILTSFETTVLLHFSEEILALKKLVRHFIYLSVSLETNNWAQNPMYILNVFE